MEEIRASGVILRLPPGWTTAATVVAGERRSVGGSAASDDDGAAALAAMLGLQAMTLLDEIGLAPAARGRRAAMPAADGLGEAELDVPLADGEDAVVLVERDGFLTWTFREPPAEARRGEPMARVAAFRLPLAGAAPAERRGVAARLGAARAFVFKVAAGVAVEGAIALQEAGVRQGLVDLRIARLPAWTTLVAPELLSPPEFRDPKLLLFLHGTFHSTLGAFGGLAGSDEGRRFLDLARQHYDQLLGFDHRTLSRDPLDNARELLDLLRAVRWATPPTIDVITHSRGALVARCFVEEVLPASGWGARVERVVFVAAPNAGTAMAKAENWRNLADVAANLAVGASRLGALLPNGGSAALMLEAAARGLGDFVPAAARHATDPRVAPGLAAMDPGGEFLAWLASRPAPKPGPVYFAVSSEFAPTLGRDHQPWELPRRFLEVVARGFARELMGVANDLVVDKASMTSFGGARGLRGRLDFGANPHVHHLGYFARPQLASRLIRWLDLVPKSIHFDRSRSNEGSAHGWRHLGEDPEGPPPRTERSIPHRGSSKPTRPRRPPLDPPILGRGGLDDADLEALPGGADAAATGPEAVLCFFHAEIDEELPVGKAATLEVVVSREELERRLGPAAAGGRGAIDLGRQLSIQIVPKENFALAEGQQALHELAPPEPGAPRRFFVVVEPTHAGDGELWVVARQGSKVLATLELRCRILAAAPPSSPGRANASGRGELSGDASATLHQLFITELKNGADVSYALFLNSPSLRILLVHQTPILNLDRVAYVDRLYRELEDRWVRNGADADNFAFDLQAYGWKLFQTFFSLDMQKALWSHRDAFDSILVTSTEPFIPWELVYLSEPGGTLAGSEGRFLGELGLLRWPHEAAGRFPQTTLAIRPGRARYLIPSYPQPGDQLPETPLEREFLERTFGATAVDPHPLPFRELLREGGFDLLHFAGHGEASHGDIAYAKLVLEGRLDGGQVVREHFDATNVEAFARLLETSTGLGPMVVLNACQAGRAGAGLIGLGGFARAFVLRGAGVFVGTLWMVGDQPARTFTETLYLELRGGQTLADATVAARQAARAAGDATWLAYVVYGHPHLVLAV